MEILSRKYFKAGVQLFENAKRIGCYRKEAALEILPAREEILEVHCLSEVMEYPALEDSLCLALVADERARRMLRGEAHEKDNVPEANLLRGYKGPIALPVTRI